MSQSVGKHEKRAGGGGFAGVAASQTDGTGTWYPRRWYTLLVALRDD